jgi:cell division protein FtsI/penicillin-binding protein 2
VQRQQEVPARRGRLLDRDGRTLAFDIEAWDVSVRRQHVRRADLSLVAAALKASPQGVQQQLQRGDSYVTLAREVSLSPDAVRRLSSLPGVCLDRRNARTYPYGALALQYLGLTNQEGHGVAGIEKAFDAALRGTPGLVTLLRDEGGQPIGRQEQRDPVDGLDVVLSIDIDLQRIADSELQRAIERTGASGGSVLIFEPHTGDLLACANGPGPANRQAEYVPDEWRNRAVYDLFEPGSTLKPITAMAALRHKVANFDTYVYAERGKRHFSGAGRVRDAHREGYAYMSFAEAFQNSSNIVYAKLARALTSQQLYEELRAFGFGSCSGLHLYGEPAGQLALPRDWSGRSRMTLGYGQEISVTAVQLANLYNAIANDGRLLQPRAALRLVDRDGKVAQRFGVREVRRVLSPPRAAEVRELCRGTVADGTAKQAHVDGLAVGGKTGTAEKAEGGNYVRKYVSSFAGMAPAMNPRLVVLVVLDEPRYAYHYGGASAAPAFQAIVSAVLRGTDWLMPDDGTVRVVRADDLHSKHPDLEAPLRLATLGAGAVPDLRGLHPRAAARWLDRLGVPMQTAGIGVVREQWPQPGQPLGKQEVVRLECRPIELPERRAALWPR